VLPRFERSRGSARHLAARNGSARITRSVHCAS